MYYAFLAPDVPAPNRANRYLYFIRVDRFMEEAYDEAFDYDWTRRGVNLLADTEPPSTRATCSRSPSSAKAAGSCRTGCRATRRYWRPEQAAERRSRRRSGCRSRQTSCRRCQGLRRAPQGHHRAVPDRLHRTGSRPRARQGLRHLHADQQPGHPARRLRSDQRALKPKGLQLKHMWREAAPRLDFVETERMNVYILQVMSILRQAYCSPKYLYYLLPGQEKTVREPDGSLRKEVLVADIGGLRGAVGRGSRRSASRRSTCCATRRSSARSRPHYLPYVSILPAFAALQAQARDAARQPTARRAAQDPPLVLGERLHQPLLGLGRVDERPRLPRRQGLVRRRRRRASADRGVPQAASALSTCARRPSAGPPSTTASSTCSCSAAPGTG